MIEESHCVEKKSMRIPVGVKLEEGAAMPVYASDGAAGADLQAYISAPVVIMPGKSALISTGLKLELPEGYEFQIRPRSGLAAKNQVTVLNTPGTVDEDYKGDIKVILINHGVEPFTVLPGMRIAQAVVAPVVRADYFIVEAVSSTVRGTGGFGHTGI